MAICPSLCVGKEDKKEIKPWVPSGGPLIKSFVNAGVDPPASEKLEKSSGGVLRLCLLAFGVSSGNLGCLSNFSPEV